jgi:TonB family protein
MTGTRAGDCATLISALMHCLFEAADSERCRRSWIWRQRTCKAGTPLRICRKGETGTVSVQLTVGTDGRVKECRVRLSSASPSLDASTCRILADRAKFDPALDRAGQPVTDRYSQRITWKIPKPDGEPVGGAKAQILVVEHADGRLDCTMWGENLAVSDPEVCQQWRK